ncbi:MAG: flagellar basal body L-ring protein FlgH, partial [Planctomycetota bacterium]
PLQASGRNDFPEVGVDFNREFNGEGEYERRDSMTTRLTGQIIDVKPNGLLVIEARTYIQNDDEIQDIKVTGTWRETDVAIDNTVLSTQGFDVRIQKTNEGELRKASKKGLFTKVLDTLFAF